MEDSVDARSLGKEASRGIPVSPTTRRATCLQEGAVKPRLELVRTMYLHMPSEC